jgi:hypothetical protein
MTPFLQELVQDARYGWRTIGANKIFSAMAILSLAPGIGANRDLRLNGFAATALAAGFESRVAGRAELARNIRTR